MDERPNKMAYKQKRAFYCSHSSQRVSECGSRSVGNGSVRQQNGSFVFAKPGWHEVTGSPGGDESNITACGESERNHPQFLSTGSLQFHSRLFVEGKESSRLASERGDQGTNFPKVGYTSNRFVCHESVEGSSTICVDRSVRSSSAVHQCVQPSLALSASLGLSSTSLNTQGTTTSQQIIGDVPCSGSALGGSLLEKRPETQSSGSSISDFQHKRELDRSIYQSTATEGRKSEFRGLEGTGWIDLVEGLDPDDVDLVQSAWRDSTWRTYQSAWKQWGSWCKQNGIIPNRPRPQQVAAYLGYLCRVRKLAPPTILVHKSVIVTLANPTQEKQLASHPLITAMVKAINIRRCSSLALKPHIWNVGDLIQWLKSHIPNRDSIFQVSRHVALLLLLASGRRVHDLTLLGIDDQHCERTESSVTFWPKFGSKTDNIYGRQSGWQLTCSGDSDLSLVKWVNCLIDVSEVRRKARSGLHSLFITTRGEVKAASRAVIAGWLKGPFEELGIRCGPGSIRSAVASNNFQHDVPLDCILKRGNWRGSENFFKHYCKPVDKPRIVNVNVLNDSFTAV